MKTLLNTLIVLSILSIGLNLGQRLWQHYVVFDAKCAGHLKRAGDANTLELAITELEVALKYMDKNDLTEGSTHVFWHTPDEDIEFWYKNTSSALKSAKVAAKKKRAGKFGSSDENIELMKLRETVVDTGTQGVTVTHPPGISIYPYNKGYMWWIIGSSLALVIFGVWRITIMD